MKRFVDAALVAGAFILIAGTSSLLLGAAAAVIYLALGGPWPN